MKTGATANAVSSPCDGPSTTAFVGYEKFPTGHFDLDFP